MNRLLLTIAAMLTLAACSRGYRDDLRQADALMEAAPDSALTLLQAVDCAALSDRDLPYYALLYTQAQVKTNVVLTSDSLISIALEAFRNSPDPDLRKRAHFYAAKVAFYSGNMPDAMRGAIVAYEISKDQNDDYWHAKSAELMADIFSSSYSYAQSEQRTREAAEYYLKAGKIRNHRYALCDLTTDYMNQGDAERALNTLDSIRKIVASETPFDSALDQYAAEYTLHALLELERYDELEQLFNKYYQPSSGTNSKLGLTLLESYIAAYNDDKTRLSSIILNAYGIADSEKQRVRVLYASFCHAKIAEEFKDATLLADTLLLMQSYVAGELLNESVTSVQRDYYSNKAVIEGQKSEHMFHLLLAVIIIDLIILTLVLLLHKQKMRANRAELESNLSALMTQKQKASDSEKKVESLFMNQWHMVNMLCNEYFELDKPEEKRSVILHKIERELNRLKTPKNLEEIEREADTYLGGIITQMRTECDFLKETDLIFLSLIISGFSARAVCILTDIKYKNYYLKKSRLIKRIAESSAPDKDKFLHRLSGS